MGIDLVRAIRITRTDVGYLYTAGAGVIHSRKNGNIDSGGRLLERSTAPPCFVQAVLAFDFTSLLTYFSLAQLFFVPSWKSSLPL